MSISIHALICRFLGQQKWNQFLPSFLHAGRVEGLKVPSDQRVSLSRGFRRPPWYRWLHELVLPHSESVPTPCHTSGGPGPPSMKFPSPRLAAPPPSHVPRAPASLQTASITACSVSGPGRCQQRPVGRLKSPSARPGLRRALLCVDMSSPLIK